MNILIIASQSDILPLSQLWPKTLRLSIPQLMGFFYKLVAGAGPKKGDAEPGLHSQVNAGIGIKVAILKQSLETERFFVVNG